VARALDRLPADQQEALRLRVVDELDYAEVAAATGASEQTIRARVSRGLRTLDRALQLDDPPATRPEHG
jgi:RNA polymerase sigma-70 factor (ECF subfamily)